MYRVFPIKPARDPDEEDKSLELYCDPMAFEVRQTHSGDCVGRGRPGRKQEERPPYAPFPNVATFEMLYWQNNGVNMKSNQQMNCLAEVMQEPDFNTADLAHFNVARELKRLDTYTEGEGGSAFSGMDRWLQGEVCVHVPKEGVHYASEEEAPLFKLKNVWHWRFREVIRSALQQECVKDWHMIPHQLFACVPSKDTSRTPSPMPSTSSCSSPSSRSPSSSFGSQSSSDSSSDDDEDFRIWTEIFNSDTALEEDTAIRAQPREAGDPDDLEYCVTLIILYSDSTQPTNFGMASLWPIYMYFGNQSKYMCGRPKAYTAHHMAYIPSVRAKISSICSCSWHPD